MNATMIFNGKRVGGSDASKIPEEQLVRTASYERYQAMTDEEKKGLWVVLDYPDDTKVLMDQNVYSTEEKVVGTWIDRRPVYGKTIAIEVIVPGQDVATPLISVPGMEFVMNYHGVVIPDWSSNNVVVLPAGSIAFKCDENGQLMYSQTFTSANVGKKWTFFLVINYIKTTDIPTKGVI